MTTTLLLFALASPGAAAPAMLPRDMEKVFTACGATVHDFGTVACGTQLSHRFRMRNPYEVPLEISVRVS